LSAELFASAACCSRAAMRFDCESGVEEFCASRFSGANPRRMTRRIKRIAIRGIRRLSVKIRLSPPAEIRFLKSELYRQKRHRPNSKYLSAVLTIAMGSARRGATGALRIFQESLCDFFRRRCFALPITGTAVAAAACNNRRNDCASLPRARCRG
jgi:hypothetical protein